MGNGAEKRLNTYLFLWNVPGRFLAYMLPRYIGFFTGLVAFVAPQFQRESPTQTRASAAKVTCFLSSPLDVVLPLLLVVLVSTLAGVLHLAFAFES